ncbi:MAG: hypothetical protein ABGX07_20040 [Pirellulaceae bacterium]
MTSNGGARVVRRRCGGGRFTRYTRVVCRRLWLRVGSALRLRVHTMWLRGELCIGVQQLL